MGEVVPLRGIAPCDRADQVLNDMLTGWRHQQLARNLSFTTIDSRARVVARFIGHCNEMPWAWTVSHVDEFFGDLRSEHNLSRLTVRAYQNGLRLFCDYLTDPRYGWDTVCEQAFSTHPSQVVHDWNSAGHHQENEQDPRKRAFTREELQAFFDRADNEVTRIRDLGRKGWLPAFRDAVDGLDERVAEVERPEHPVHRSRAVHDEADVDGTDPIGLRCAGGAAGPADLHRDHLAHVP